MEVGQGLAEVRVRDDEGAQLELDGGHGVAVHFTKNRLPAGDHEDVGDDHLRDEVELRDDESWSAGQVGGGGDDGVGVAARVDVNVGLDVGRRRDELVGGVERHGWGLLVQGVSLSCCCRGEAAEGDAQPVCTPLADVEGLRPLLAQGTLHGEVAAVVVVGRRGRDGQVLRALQLDRGLRWYGRGEHHDW